MRLAPRLPDGRRFSWQVDLRLMILAFVGLLGFLAAVVYNGRGTEHASAGSAAERLQPVTNPPASSGPLFPAVIESVRYYDSHGRLIRDHLTKPAELAALASVEFVVKEADTAGGPGANFLVKWSGPSDVDEPLIEAVMLGRSANAGISFTSVGRVITNEPQ